MTVPDTNNSSSSSTRSENDPPSPSAIPQNLLDLVEEALTHVMKTFTVSDEEFLPVKAKAREEILAMVKSYYVDSGEETVCCFYLNKIGSVSNKLIAPPFRLRNT